MISPAYTINKWTSNRWFAVGLLLAMAVLLALVAVTMDSDSKPLPGLFAKADPVDRLVPVKKIEQLSADLRTGSAQPLANGKHPFFTDFFKPPPPPPEPTPVVKVEPPPAPIVKKIPILYQGLYQTADGRNQAFLRREGKLLVVSLGGTVVDNWNVADIGRQKLTLTNQAAETTILEFNREKTIEVPVK